MPLCWCLCINRWNDATTGPKLPRIQERDHFGFVKMSLLICFSDAVSGFLSGAMASIYLTERFGFGKILSALLQIGAYAMLVPAGPFPVICIVYCIIGFTLAIQAAQTTVFVVSLKKKFAAKMELLHGIYGLGALVSPLVATQSSGSPRFWSHHFITSKRGGSLNPGVISSGIILGRLGDRRALFLWERCPMVWTICLIPSLIENAVAVSVVGLLLGPMFPILTNLPKWLMTGCAYNIAGVGQASSAVLPFLTGVLASKFEPS
ncbi:hypothetical protein BD309DRAFT_1073203 [Dichomitus squalens]|nr:hypothetical protein BD309DRAFT_1073203 [Dichomitus squalens]